MWLYYVCYGWETERNHGTGIETFLLHLLSTTSALFAKCSSFICVCDFISLCCFVPYDLQYRLAFYSCPWLACCAFGKPCPYNAEIGYGRWNKEKWRFILGSGFQRGTIAAATSTACTQATL